MKTLPSSGTKSVVGSLFAVLALAWSLTAAADPVVRYVHFTALSPQQQQAALKLVDTEINKAYLGAKGFKWVKFLMDSTTLELASVSLWDSRADLDAFLKSDAYKGTPDKLKPLMKGTMSSVVYDVYEPKK